jgi:hypothetical protein
MVDVGRVDNRRAVLATPQCHVAEEGEVCSFFLYIRRSQQNYSYIP